MPRRSIATWVQALLHLPLWGAFQRSLTLLVRYRSQGVLSLRGRCPRCSRGISNPRYSGADARCTSFCYGIVTLYHPPFQESSQKGSSDECQSEHHIAREGLRFGLDRVHSRLLTMSRIAFFSYRY